MGKQKYHFFVPQGSFFSFFVIIYAILSASKKSAGKKSEGMISASNESAAGNQRAGNQQAENCYSANSTQTRRKSSR